MHRYDPPIRKGARPSAAALVLLLQLAGCGGSDPGVPVACREGPQAVRAALARAPAPVRLGSTPLSRCFARGSSASDVQEVGATFLAVVQQLGPRARAAPSSREALELGYLVGAVRRGAGKGYGVYYESERRIESELAGVRQRSPAFARGERAGEQSG